jgi:ribosome-binding factor A
MKVKVRAERIALQMQREISDIIQSQVKDPRVGFVTVTAVEVTNDFQHAKVYISVLGNEGERENSLHALDRARGFIRTEIGRRIRLRLTPEIQFVLDESLDYSMKIGRVLHEIFPQSETDGEKRDSDGE